MLASIAGGRYVQARARDFCCGVFGFEEENDFLTSYFNRFTMIVVIYKTQRFLCFVHYF